MNIYAVIISLFFLVALLAALYVIVRLTKLHYEEKESLLAKLASKSLAEAEYYRKEYPEIVKERIKGMEEERKRPLTAEEVRKVKAASGF